MEEGFDGVVRGARVLNAQIDMPLQATGSVLQAQPSLRRAGPEKTEEREADLAGGRAALDCVTVTLTHTCICMN